MLGMRLSGLLCYLACAALGVSAHATSLRKSAGADPHLSLLDMQHVDAPRIFVEGSAALVAQTDSLLVFHGALLGSDALTADFDVQQQFLTDDMSSAPVAVLTTRKAVDASVCKEEAVAWCQRLSHLSRTVDSEVFPTCVAHTRCTASSSKVQVVVTGALASSLGQSSRVSHEHKPLLALGQLNSRSENTRSFTKVSVLISKLLAVSEVLSVQHLSLGTLTHGTAACARHCHPTLVDPASRRQRPRRRAHLGHVHPGAPRLRVSGGEHRRGRPAVHH